MGSFSLLLLKYYWMSYPWFLNIICYIPCINLQGGDRIKNHKEIGRLKGWLNAFEKTVYITPLFATITVLVVSNWDNLDVKWTVQEEIIASAVIILITAGIWFLIIKCLTEKIYLLENEDSRGK